MTDFDHLTLDFQSTLNVLLLTPYLYVIKILVRSFDCFHLIFFKRIFFKQNLSVDLFLENIQHTIQIRFSEFIHKRNYLPYRYTPVSQWVFGTVHTSFGSNWLSKLLGSRLFSISCNRWNCKSVKKSLLTRHKSSIYESRDS